MTATPVTDPPPASFAKLAPFYVGGFLGPFGTMVILPMLPELRDRFGVDSATISWGLSAYLFPMAALLLVSGTIGERLGRRLVLRLALAAYVMATVMAALAPSIEVFLAARAAQGVGNAFITPLMIAGLAALTPPDRLGGRVGIYTAFQALGGGMAPFAGGLAAAVDWRLAFWAAAVVTAAVGLLVPADDGQVRAAPPSFRSLIDRRLLTLGVGTFAAAAGPIGAGILVGLKARDILGMSPTTAGLLLAGASFGSAAMAPGFGRLLDRYGARRCGIASTVAISGLVSLLGLTGTVGTTAVVYLVAGSLVSFMVVVIQQVGASILPANRGGALSAILSFRFVGHAAGPLLWVPVLERSEAAAFAGSAALGVATVAALLIALPQRTAATAPAPAA